MRCRRARKLTFEFIDGRIDDVKRLELEKHLAECAECEKFSSQLTRSMDLVHRAPVEMPDENFAWKVRLKLNQERKAIKRSTASDGSLIRSWNVRYAAGAVAACAVVVVAGFLAVQQGLDVFGPKNTLEAASPEVAADAGNTADPASVASETSRSANPPSNDRPRLSWPGLGHGIQNRSLVSPVSGGAGRRQSLTGAPGAIDQFPGGVVLDLDSILQMEIDRLPPEQRIRYIQERIRLLQVQLEKHSRQNPTN